MSGVSNRISHLWSLRWEVIFSVALPLYVVFGQAHPTPPFWIPMGVALGLVAWGSRSAVEGLVYLPMFAVGAVIALHWDEIGRLTERLSERRWGWHAFVLVALLLTGALWELQGLGMTRAESTPHEWVTVVGVTMLVAAAGFCPGASRFLSRPVLRWLGTVSFSLCLIHEPIVIAVSLLVADASPWAGVLIAIPVSLALAAAFHAAVERPSHRLTRRIGHA